MTVIAAWLRLDLRRRWRSLVVLALLVAAAAGTIATALAGARRGASSLTRLQESTLPATSAVLANTPGFDWGPVRRLPEVAALTTFVVDYTMSIDGVPGQSISFPPGDDQTMRTIEKPIVLAGRVFDPRRANEAVVTRDFPDRYDKGVGDTVVVHLPTRAELDAQRGSGPQGAWTGPAVRVRIVGVGISPWFSDGPGQPGGIVLSPGFTAKYHTNVIGNPADKGNRNFVNGLVRLRHGEKDIPRLRDDITRLTGRSDIDVWDLPEAARQQQRNITFESRSLVAFAGAALLAALFLVGQAIARYAASTTSELQTLRAVGMTPRQSVLTATASPLLAGAAGALAALVGAYIASGWFPIGTARYVEPQLGRQADWYVFGGTLVAVPILVAAGAAAAAAVALGAGRRERAQRVSTVARALARAGAAVPVVVGAQFALETGRGRSSVPVRPALVGAVIGVLGIVAAFTFSHGVSDAAAHPERFGQTAQLGAFVGINSRDFQDADRVDRALHQLPDVISVDDSRSAVATGPGGNDSVALWEWHPGRKALPLVLTSGRAPRRADEVLLGPDSLAALHASVGSTVRLTGSGPTRTLHVTGSGFVLEGPHNGYAEGGWVPPAAFDALFGSRFKYHIVLITLRPSARSAHAAATIAAGVSRIDPSLKGLDVEAADLPEQIAELRQVRTLPIVLGIFLAVLAVGAVGHALATAVRRRSHDLAVLRALGMTRGQCRWVIFTQASVLALIGLVFGVPLGLALGRTVWRSVANYTPLQYVPPLAVTSLLAVVPLALVLANALAALPGHRASRLRIAAILRAE